MLEPQAQARQTRGPPKPQARAPCSRSWSARTANRHEPARSAAQCLPPRPCRSAMRGLVKAERFATGSPMRSPSLRLNCTPSLLVANRHDRGAAGRGRAGVRCAKGLGVVQLARDGYTGYLAREAPLRIRRKATHRVATLWALGFKTADIKSPLRLVLPMGARMTGEMAGDFNSCSTGVHIPISTSRLSAVASRNSLRSPAVRGHALRRWQNGAGIDCSDLCRFHCNRRRGSAA